MNLPDGYFLQNKKYQLTHVIGQGGFGITYLGVWNTEVKGRLGVMKTKVPVCIKEYFFKDYCYRDKGSYAVKVHSATGGKLFDKFKEKLIKEANILSAVHHPHIVNVLEVFEENNTAYIIMEYIKGCSLKYMLDKEGVLPENKALKYVHQIGNALDFVHDKNIVHLDIKPSNILIGKDDNARLIDFGVSKRYDIDERETSTTTLSLSKGFASIEQYDDEGTQSFSPCPDIYSLGATMYNLLTGVIPVESILRVTKRMPSPSSYNAHITKKTEKVILKAMEVKPENRYQVVKEMLASLDIPPYELTENNLIETKRITDDEFTEPIRVCSLGTADDTDDDRTVPISSFANGKHSKNSDNSKRRSWKRIFLAAFILFFSFVGYAVYNYFMGVATPQSLTFEIGLPERNDDKAMNVSDGDGSVSGESAIDSLRPSEYDEQQQALDEQPPQFQTNIPASNTESNRALELNPASNSKRNPTFRSNQETTHLIQGGTSPEKSVNETPVPEEEAILEEKYNHLLSSAKTKMEKGDYSNAEADLKVALHIKMTNEVMTLLLQCRYYIFDTIDFGNLKIVRNRKTTRYGAIDEKGEERIPCKYIIVDKSVYGRAFLREDHMYDIYDAQGKYLKTVPESLD
jgi:serine/threonine-protein kinase